MLVRCYNCKEFVFASAVVTYPVHEDSFPEEETQDQNFCAHCSDHIHKRSVRVFGTYTSNTSTSAVDTWSITFPDTGGE